MTSEPRQWDHRNKPSAKYWNLSYKYEKINKCDLRISVCSRGFLVLRVYTPLSMTNATKTSFESETCIGYLKTNLNLRACGIVVCPRSRDRRHFGQGSNTNPSGAVCLRPGQAKAESVAVFTASNVSRVCVPFVFSSLVVLQSSLEMSSEVSDAKNDVAVQENDKVNLWIWIFIFRNVFVGGNCALRVVCYPYST